MYQFINREKKFEKDYAKRSGTGEDLTDVDSVLRQLILGETLDKKLYDHPLEGDLKGSRCVHIRGNLLLIYRRNKKKSAITFIRLATHHQLLKR